VGFTGRFAFLMGESMTAQKEQKMTLQLPLENFSDYRLPERTRMVLALARFRMEWQKAVNNGSLLKIESPVSLLLADIAEKLELSTQERHVFLGGKLINEVDAFLETRIARKLFN
jgi:hypothetical protein